MSTARITAIGSVLLLGPMGCGAVVAFTGVIVQDRSVALWGITIAVCGGALSIALLALDGWLARRDRIRRTRGIS